MRWLKARSNSFDALDPSFTAYALRQPLHWRRANLVLYGRMY
jgi:hypothetical protein